MPAVSTNTAAIIDESAKARSSPVMRMLATVFQFSCQTGTSLRYAYKGNVIQRCSATSSVTLRLMVMFGKCPLFLLLI